MKKIIALILATLMLVFCFASCTKDETAENNDVKNNEENKGCPVGRTNGALFRLILR